MTDLSLTEAGNLRNHMDSKKERLEKAAGQLEGVFLTELFKHAQDGLAIGEDEGGFMAKSSATKQFTDMLHGALVERSTGDLGLKKTIVDSIAGGKTNG